MNKNKLLDQFQLKVSDVNSCQEHFHTEIELLYMLEGSMNLTVGEQSFEMHKDDIIVINENKRHSFTSSAGSLFCEIVIPYEIISEHAQDAKVFLFCNSTVEQNEAYDSLRAVLRKMLTHYVRSDGDIHSFSQIGLFFNLLEVLSFHFLISGKDKISYSDRYDERIEMINSYVRNRYNEQISLNELSQQLYLSNAYLSRFFKKNYGMNFAEYLTNIRLFHAVDDLIYTDNPIVRVALDNGFSSVTHFNKVFKSIHGETPTAFRNKSRKEKTEDTRSIPSQIQEKLVNVLVMQNDEKKEYVVKDNLEIHADTKISYPYDQNWNQVINMGMASDFLEAGLQDHALIMKKKFGFSCMRIWNIFSEDMFVSMDSDRGIENFRHFDIVFDFLVENRITPFLELNMDIRYEIDNFNEAIFKRALYREDAELSRWGKILEDFLKHVIHRYGRTTVENWRFEIWDCWQGQRETDALIVRYLKNFENAYMHIKKLLPNSQVGGCGSAGFYDKDRFFQMLQLWKSYAPIPDFFSVKIFGYIKREDESVVFSKRTTNQDFVSHELELIQKAFETFDFNVKQLYVSEWASTLSNRNLLNDSCYNGAFNMKTMIQCIGKADLMMYSEASDNISEYYDTIELLYGGLGMLTKDDIIKPSGYACLFMNQLYDKYIQKGDNYLITTDEQGDYGIVCHNCKKLNYHYFVTDENELNRDEIWQYYEDNDAFVMNFCLDNVENGVYQIQIQQINEKHGSVLDQWKNMNYYDDLPREAVDYLKRMAQPYMSLYRVEVTDGKLHMNMQLLANEIDFIKIEKLLV